MRMSVHKEHHFCNISLWWNSFGTSSGYSGLSGSSWSRISILLRRHGNGIHCTGSLATWNCWLLEYWGFLRNLWKYCSRLELCRNWFLLALPWLDEVAVSPEALSSCWNLNHVGVGFSALLTYHSFFILPRIRILEPYILSCLKWQCFNSILEIFDISIELAFFLCYEFSLLADPVIHHL